MLRVNALSTYEKCMPELFTADMQKGEPMDLIERQQAIDAVSRGCQEFRGIFAECEKNLNALPSAQPTQSNASNVLKTLDCIDRQAAIDAICAVCGNDCDKSEFVYNAPQDEQVILCPEHYCLCTLPSAQPEIVRCKDCKYADNDGVCQNSVGLVIQDDDDFCSKAERRTDE